MLPDIGVDLALVDNDTSIDADEKRHRKEAILSDYATKADRIHTVQQLLKAYTLFDKDVEYVVMDGSVKIVMNKPVVFSTDAATVMVCTRQLKRKRM